MRKQRVRTKGGYLPQTEGVLHITYPGQEPFSSQVRFPPMYADKTEYMADVVPGWQSDFNPCDHYKLLAGFTPVSYLLDGDPEGAYTTYSMSGGGVSPVGLLETMNSTAYLSPQYCDDFSARAEDHYKTAVDDSASFLNFIIELIEMCEGNIVKLESLSKKAKIAIESFFTLFKRTGNYWVSWNFAIRPFVSDVMAFLTTYRRAIKRLKWLRKVNHKPVKQHYRESAKNQEHEFVLEIPWLTGVPPDGEPPPMVDGGYFRVTFSAECRLSSWAWTQFDIDDAYLDDFVTSVGMICAVMNGLYNPLKVAWEAIPFSWLIEWFTSKRTQLLKEMGNLSPFADARILGIGYSFKVKAFGNVQLVMYDSPGDPVWVGPYLYSRFLRRPGLPSGDSAIWDPHIDLGQFGILVGIGSNWGPRRR